MKTIRILALVIGISMMAFFSQAQAASFLISPTGSFDAAASSTITYNVSLVLESEWSLAGWDVTFLYDQTELIPLTWSNAISGEVITTPSEGTIHSNYFNVQWPAVADPVFPAGTNALWSFTFSIISQELYDGLADFSVRSQVAFPQDVFLTSLYEEIHLEGFSGADVGVVPVPAAVWLLGTGLIGLISVRRKIKS